jgi:chromate transporter
VIEPLFSRLIEVAALFLRLGLTAFGGPAPAIAMMRDEVVTRRQWLDDQEFLDLLGATNLSPGPTATKLAMYLGQRRAGGLVGLALGGLCYLLPSTLMMLALAWAYVEYGATPAAGWLLYGIKPVIIPLIALALWPLGRQAVKNATTGAVGIAVALLSLANLNPLTLLIGGGVAALLARRARAIRRLGFAPLWVPGLFASSAAVSVSLGQLFLLFFKVGAVMYGSGYVLIAFLQDDLVERRGWLTGQQLIDAIAAGQLTPGPLSASATFIGYLLDGGRGAAAATVGIFLPAFIIVGVSMPLIPRLRRSAWASDLLDGVNAAAWGLMVAVTWNLARAAFPDAFSALIAVIGAGLLLRYKMNSVGLIAFGAGMGLLSSVM